MKKETFWKKSDRVYKELCDILKKKGKITLLTEEQRYIMTTNFGNDESVYKTFKIDADIYMDDVLNSAERLDNKDKLVKAISDAFDRAEKFATKNKLVYVSYAFDDYNGCPDEVAVSGYERRTDKEMIDEFTAYYNKEEARAVKAVKYIDGKKYQLVEE